MVEKSERELWELSNFKNAYLQWLVRTMNANDYSILMDYLYDCEFVCRLQEDSRREISGRYLRERFKFESGLSLPANGLDWEASFLEVLVSLAYSLEDILHDPVKRTSPAMWFHEMLVNSGLSVFTDEYVLDHTGFGFDANIQMAEAVDRILLRRYSVSGRGSLFPPRKDGRNVRQMPLWDQLLAYANSVIFD